MRALAIAVLSVLLWVPQAGAASSFLEFFTWSPRTPQDLRRALALYEKGDSLAAVAAAKKADGGDRTYRDDALFIGALAYADLGWRREAEQSFTALLEASEPSPYYPLALLRVVEIAHEEGRVDAVVEAYRRYWEIPWRGSSRREMRRRNLLQSYGDVRAADPLLTQDEKDLLATPTRLAERLQRRRERPSDRLLYLAGLDLFRAREFSRSLEALSRIGIESSYFPYAQYTAAQDLWALGDLDQAGSHLALLRRYPLLDGEERALGERAGLLYVQMLFEAGETDEAVDAARRVGAGGRYASTATLLRAEIVLAADQPSFALAFYEDVKRLPLGSRLDAERALGVGQAYAELGDFASATASLRGASEVLGGEIRRLRPPGSDVEVARLHGLVEAAASEARRAEALRRRRLAEGIRRVLAFKGPMNLGKLSRVTFASHRNTVVGFPVYDLALLAESERPKRTSAPATEGPWLRYVESARREKIDAAATRSLKLREKGVKPEQSLDTLLGIAEGRFGGSPQSAADAIEAFRHAATSSELSREITPAEIALLRRRLLADSETLPHFDEGAALENARRLLDEVSSFELAAMVAAEAEDLRRIEFDLQNVLSETIARQNAQTAVMRSQQGTAKSP